MEKSGRERLNASVEQGGRRETNSVIDEFVDGLVDSIETGNFSVVGHGGEGV